MDLVSILTRLGEIAGETVLKRLVNKLLDRVGISGEGRTSAQQMETLQSAGDKLLQDAQLRASIQDIASEIRAWESLKDQQRVISEDLADRFGQAGTEKTDLKIRLRQLDRELSAREVKLAELIDST